MQEVKGQKEETTGRSTEVKTFLYFNTGANSGNCLSCRSHDVTAITLRSNKGNCTARKRNCLREKQESLGLILSPAWARSQAGGGTLSPKKWYFPDMPCMKAGNPEIAMLESAPGEKNCLKGLKIPLPGFPYSQLFNFMQFSQKTIVFIYKWKRDLFTCVKKLDN